MKRLGILTAMLDQFALTMLINTPEIAESKKEQAIAAGERRHRGWQRAVQQLLMEMRRFGRSVVAISPKW